MGFSVDANSAFHSAETGRFLSKQSIVEATSFAFTWHTSWNEPCHKCLQLEGTRWDGVSLSDPVLVDERFGPVWDIQNDVPLTHPNCKCFLEVEAYIFPEQTTMIKGLFKDIKAFRGTSKTPSTSTSEPNNGSNEMPSNIKETREELEGLQHDLQRAENRINSTKFELMTYMTLLNRAHLPPEIDKAINVLVRIKMTTEMASRSLYLMMAASGPAGWAMALATAGITVIGVHDIAMDLSG